MTESVLIVFIETKEFYWTSSRGLGLRSELSKELKKNLEYRNLHASKPEHLGFDAPLKEAFRIFF